MSLSQKMACHSQKKMNPARPQLDIFSHAKALRRLGLLCIGLLCLVLLCVTFAWLCLAPRCCALSESSVRRKLWRTNPRENIFGDLFARASCGQMPDRAHLMICLKDCLADGPWEDIFAHLSARGSGGQIPEKVSLVICPHERLTGRSPMGALLCFVWHYFASICFA